jgi:outer membrane biogenesis lipoprotein LolB
MRTFVAVVLAAAGLALAACGTTDRGLDAKTQADQISTQINEQVQKANTFGQDQEQDQP